MSEESGPTPPAGWYPAPDGGSRYWDGGQWLDLPAPDDAALNGKRRHRRKTRIVIAVTVAAVVVVLGGVGIATWTVVASQQAAEQHAAEVAATQQAEEAAREKQAQEAQAAADDSERASRASQVKDIEKSIKAMANKHVKDDLIDGPVLRVNCDPVNGGSTDDLTQQTTVFKCFVSTKDLKDGTFEGYFYNATMNWDTGSYTYGIGEP